MEELCEQVAGVLQSLGMNAVTWDADGAVGVGLAPGGTPPEELRFFFGTAASVWSGELFDDEAKSCGRYQPHSRPASREPGIIAAGIVQAIAKLAASSR